MKIGDSFLLNNLKNLIKILEEYKKIYGEKIDFFEIKIKDGEKDIICNVFLTMKAEKKKQKMEIL